MNIEKSPVRTGHDVVITPDKALSNNPDGFSRFNLDTRIMAGVRANRYDEPTPVQAQAIPYILEGRDVLGLAQTGTGKTAAFVLPLLQRLLPGRRRVLRALIISPTRELAEQIYDSVSSLGRSTGLRCTAVYGGVGMEQQVSKLKDGYEIVVACPGRLLDHIWRGTIDLDMLESLVIDEADRMFDMGFLPDIRNIVRCLPVARQTLMFSATMPEDIRRLVMDVLRNPVTVQVGYARPARTVSHCLYPVPKHLKAPLLVSVLRQIPAGSVLVFTRTKRAAEGLADKLARAGFSVASLQGNLTQSQRERAMDAFRGGSARVMVATDIAARGLDILSISHVVNYDMPDCVDTYTHRIGRTGRVENTGQALTFITEDDSRMVREIENILGYRIERHIMPGFDYTKPQQFLGKPNHARMISGRRCGSYKPRGKNTSLAS